MSISHYLQEVVEMDSLAWLQVKLFVSFRKSGLDHCLHLQDICLVEHALHSRSIGCL